MSHLDLLKVFTRCARRTGLDLEYSQGFNPHAEMVFSAPLPLGMTSEAEYVDIDLTGERDTEELLEVLIKSLPSGIVPVKIRKLEPGEGSVMKPVRYAAYRISVSCPEGEVREIFLDAVGRCLESGEAVMTAKKSKSGVKVVDIRPMILSFGSDPAVCEGGQLSFGAVLACGNEVNLRPEVAFRGIFDKISGVDISKSADEQDESVPGPFSGFEFVSAHKLVFLDSEKNELW